MALKDKWKNFGKNTGKAFTNFGKTVGKTARVVFAGESNEVEENGSTELANDWKETGKSFGRAGKSLGKAAQGTGQKIIGVEQSEDESETTVEKPEEIIIDAPEEKEDNEK